MGGREDERKGGRQPKGSFGLDGEVEGRGDFLFHVSLTKKLDRCSMQWRRESVINACQNILVRSVMRASVGRSRSL